MKKYIYAICATLVMGLLTGCPLMTREDIQKQDEDRQLKEQVSAIQKQKADNEMRYSDVQNDLRAIAGRVEAVDHNSHELAQNNSKQIEDLKGSINQLNEKLKILEQHMDATETRLTAAIQAATNSATAAPPPSSNKKEDVEDSKDSKKEGKKGDLFSEAEALFAKKDFKHAIIKYQSYRDKSPKGSKVAEATYKIGVCFQELGSKKDAKDFYQETVDSFAGTPSAKKAKFRLSQLK